MGNVRDIYIHIKHANNDIDFLLNEKIANRYKITNNYKVKSGTAEALEFVVTYLNFYSDEEEIPEPEHPLASNKTLKDIFEDELHLFKRIITNDKQELKNITPLILDIVDITQELSTKILYNKFMAILCYYIIA